MPIREERIQSLSRFLEIIEEISEHNNSVWFRGHESIRYTLAPSIYRAPYTSRSENSFHAKFRSRAIPYLNTLPSHDDYWSWLFLMQHHNVPTRLLDWSTGALYALAFAILLRNNNLGDDDAVVWCLLPEILNDAQRVRIRLDASERIPNINVDSSKTKIEGAYSLEAVHAVDYPLALTGPLNSNRIVAQKGTFTLFPDRGSFNLEDTPDAEQFLIKIIIEHNRINTIKRQLVLLGITETSIYPELNSLGSEIKREFQP